MSYLVAVVLVGALLFALVFLAVAESALLGMSRARANALAEDGVPGAERLVAGLEDRTTLVAPILALALACQLGLGAVVAIVVGDRLGNGWVPVGLVVALFAMFILTESVPKSWARGNIDRAAIAAARAALLLSRTPPFGWIIGVLVSCASLMLGRMRAPAAAVSSEEEIVALADAAVAADVLEKDEGEIIHSLLDFGDALVRDVMIPRPDVLAVADDTTVSEAIDRLVERGVSRMPIYGEDSDDIRGVVHIKDLFARVQRGRGDHFVTIAARTPMFVPETKRAAELLRELKGVPTSLVVVIDEFGGMAGIVTMEDLIEEFIGEIVDEFDANEEPMLQPLRSGEWRANARIPIDEFNERVGAALPDDECETLGGLILDGLGHVPTAGETHREAGYDLHVEEVDGRRITRVRVTRLEAESGALANG